jgi:hypothetical protein
MDLGLKRPGETGFGGLAAQALAACPANRRAYYFLVRTMVFAIVRRISRHRILR